MHSNFQRVNISFISTEGGLQRNLMFITSSAGRLGLSSSLSWSKMCTAQRRPRWWWCWWLCLPDPSSPEGTSNVLHTVGWDLGGTLLNGLQANHFFTRFYDVVVADGGRRRRRLLGSLHKDGLLNFLAYFFVVVLIWTSFSLSFSLPSFLSSYLRYVTHTHTQSLCLHSLRS